MIVAGSFMKGFHYDVTAGNKVVYDGCWEFYEGFIKMLVRARMSSQ